MTPQKILKLALAITLAGVALSARADYSFIALGTLGGSYSSARGINDAEQVVGYSSTTSNFGTFQATLWDGTTATALGTLTLNRQGLSYDIDSPSMLALPLFSANAINNAGQVVGGGPYATVWNENSATALGSLSGGTGFGSGINYNGQSNANAINNTGQIVGSSSLSSGYNYGNPAPVHATIWNAGIPTDLGSLGGGDSFAYGISDAGQVVGFSTSAEGFRATIWNGTTITDLGTLGGNYSVASAINNNGLVVGYSSTPGNNFITHATLWNGTIANDLGALDGTSSYATGVNNAGQVVGWFNLTTEISHAALWQDGTAIDLNSYLSASDLADGWVLIAASGINSQGSIVGDAYNSNSNTLHAFKMVAAVPEPKTYLMLFLGLGLIGFMVGGRKAGKT